MKIRGRKLKTSLSCTLSLLLALSSFGFALAETQTQRYNVPLSAELVPEGYLDFAISAGTITATNTRENPNTLTFSDIKVQSNESSDPIKVSSIAYQAQTDASFELTQDFDTDFTTVKDKFSLVVSDGVNNWDFAANENAAFEPRTTIEAQDTKTFTLSGHVSSVTEDTSHIKLGSLVVTLEATEDYASQPYVLLESMESGKTFNVSFGDDVIESLQISTDGDNWGVLSSVGKNFNNVDKLYMRGKDEVAVTTLNDGSASSLPGTIAVFGDASVKVSGNIMSLLDYETLPTKDDEASVGAHAFDSLFYGSGDQNSTALVDASDLIMPATEIGEYAYKCMFWCCSTLKYPPALPVKKAADESCASMFSQCSSLEAIPLLYITDFGASKNTLSAMFGNIYTFSICENKSETHTNKYRIPAQGTATYDAEEKQKVEYPTYVMFYSGKISSPELNKDYYVNTMVVPAY